VVEKVSIIIPLYNREKLIIETLQSLYSQSYLNWEAIIIDDVSTDNSLNVVKTEAKKDGRVNVFIRNREPKGAPTCRNIGIEKASGEYVIFLDSDDILARYSIQERIKRFQKHPDFEYLVFNGAFFEEKPGDTDILWNKFTDIDDLTRFYSGEPVWQTTGPIWKRSALLQNNLLFEETAKSSQDWEFHIKALQIKIQYKKIDILPDYFVRRSQRQESNAISSSHNHIDKVINRIDLFEALFLNNKNLTKSNKSALFRNLYFQIFNVYTSCSYTQLRHLITKVQKTGIKNKFTIVFWHLFLKTFLFLYKIGIKKVQIVAYFFSRKGLSTCKNIGYYRSKMDNLSYERLRRKLNDR